MYIPGGLFSCRGRHRAALSQHATQKWENALLTDTICHQLDSSDGRRHGVVDIADELPPRLRDLVQHQTRLEG